MATVRVRFPEDEFPEFIITSGGMTATVCYSDPSACSQAQWECLFDGERCCLEFCESNGLVSLASDGEEVTFDVAKAGSGGDGSITITVPFASCAEAFQVCLQRQVWVSPWQAA